MLTVLLIIASQGYQPLEYGHTRKMLEQAGIKVEVASDANGIAVANPHQKPCHCNSDVHLYEKAHVDLNISQVDPKKYDGIFIVGGPGALSFLDKEVTYNIIRTIAKRGKAFGAICISPRILAKAGVLDGKKATGWDEDNQLSDIFKKHHTTYIQEPVVIDGNIITANGPAAALNFGKAIAKVLKKKT